MPTSSAGPRPRLAARRLSGAAGRRIELLQAGGPSQPPAVLLHGLGGSAEEMLEAFASPLRRLGYRALAPNRPGYGRSEPPGAEGAGPLEQAERLAAALAPEIVAPPLLIMHSYGASVGLALAERLGGRVRGLLFLSPFCRPTPPGPAPLLRLAALPRLGPVLRRRLLPALAPRLARILFAASARPDPAAPELLRLPARDLLSAKAVSAMIGELLAFNADAERIGRGLGRLRAPALVVSGRSDRVVDARAHAAWLAERLPNCRRLELRGGHLLHHARPEVAERALRRLSRRARVSGPGALRRGDAEGGRLKL